MEQKSYEDERREEEEEDNTHKYKENEIHAKFRITSQEWNDALNDPESEEYQEMANTVEQGIMEMLHEDESFTEQAKFKVTIESFR